MTIPKLQIVETKAKILSFTPEELRQNVHYACRLRLPEVKLRAKDKAGEVLIVAGGPSLKDSFEEIRGKQQKGSLVACVGATYDLLVTNGIIPTYYVLLDATPAIATFFTPRKDTKYLVASQCNSMVFEKLKGYDVSLWHPQDTYGNEPIIRGYNILSPLVPGGSTTALRSFELLFRMGYRKFIYYGVDSSSDGDLYAYELKPGNRDNPEDKVEYPVYLVTNKGISYEFKTTVDLACQASEFLVLCKKYVEAQRKGRCMVSIDIQGRGMVPSLWALYTGMKPKDPEFDLGIAIQEGSWDAYKATEEDFK
jgi:hypothetical protein